MYHYTYIITNIISKRYYIGVRSCNIDPSLDVEYLGSSKYLNEDINLYGKDFFTKDIIQIFDNRKSAMDHEIELHNFFDVENNDLFYNKFNANASGFNWYGKNHSNDTIEKIKEKRKSQNITTKQIEKFKKTWNTKSKKEKEVYAQFRKDIWNKKTEIEKENFRKKMSFVSKKSWEMTHKDQRKERAKKILETKSKWSDEKKQEVFKNRSIAQKKSKNNRTQEEVKQTVEKRKKTYENMSENQKKEIRNKHRKKMCGRKWYNNGEISKMFFDHLVPEGFKLGRII